MLKKLKDVENGTFFVCNVNNEIQIGNNYFLGNLNNFKTYVNNNFSSSKQNGLINKIEELFDKFKKEN